MNRVEINSIRHDVYTLWYHSEIAEEKKILKKVLDLIDHAEDLRHCLHSITKLYGGSL